MRNSGLSGTFATSSSNEFLADAGSPMPVWTKAFAAAAKVKLCSSFASLANFEHSLNLDLAREVLSSREYAIARTQALSAFNALTLEVEPFTISSDRCAYFSARTGLLADVM